MEELNWMTALEYRQEFHHLSRTLLPQEQKGTLTASERELLGLVYLQTGECTPLILSRESGMKKEAVSRGLRNLYDKGCILREKHPRDERSCLLSLTEAGQRALEESYSAILKPLYVLRRRLSPEDFDLLFTLIKKANADSLEGKEGNEHALL